MKKKKVFKVFLYAVSIAFVIGGIISIAFGIKDIITLKIAKYTQEVEGIVIDAKIENSRPDYLMFQNFSSAEVKTWITKEEIIINGEKKVFNLRYNTDPGNNIKHTVISNDGENWEVNDSSMETLIVTSLAGLIACIAGCVFAIFVKRVI